MTAARRIVLALLAASLAASFSYAAENPAADKLTPPLRQVLERAGEGELVPVSIVLGDQLEGARLLARVPTPLQGEARRQAVLAALKEHAGATQGRVLALLEGAGLEGKARRVRPLWIGNVVGADLTPDQIRLVAGLAEVARINHNPKVDVFLERSLPDPGESLLDGGGSVSEIECGTDLMRAPEVWNDLGITGEGAVIAVIDTGVCWSHPDIENQIWVNPGEDLDGDGVVMDPDDENGIDDDANGFVDDLIGWDFDIGDNDPNDDSNGHGSHCAGTVAGDGTQGTQSGMAPDAKVMPVRVGVTFADEVDVWNAMQYAADNGADAISMSLGWPHNQNPDRATWRTNCENTIEAGTAMVIAAGNEGQGNEPDNVRTPGDVPRIISVGAVDCSDNAASFTSRGPVTWQDVPPWNDWPYPPGLIKPDISAPGVNTKSHNFCSGYTNKSGTSMATPHVAGAVALMVSTNPGLTHDDIKLILEETSIDLGAAGKDNTFGTGRVDAYEAVLRSGSSDGIVRLDRDLYACLDEIGILVADKDLAGTGTLLVEISSATETAPEAVSLAETGSSSGVFRGSIPTSSGDPTPDGVLQVIHDDLIEVLYVDADDGEGGTNVEKRDQAHADCREPFISLVRAEDIDNHAGTVRWSTDEASTSDVLYGTSKPPTTPKSAGGLTSDHSVRLTGLPECTIVYYEVSSADPRGNAASDDNGGAFYYFETYGNFPGVGIVPCHAGQVTLDAEVFSCEDAVTATVVDIDLNSDPGLAETVEVTLTSSTETSAEPLLLVETGPNTSQFRGTLATAPGAPAPDGVLQTSDGDVITATYRDQDDGTGRPGVSSASAAADCGGPEILNLRVDTLTYARGTVRFETSEAATATLDWGTTPALGETEEFTLPAASFSVVLNKFDLCDTVYLRVRATDAHGNTSVSDLGGAPFHFNTFEIPGLYWMETFEDGGPGWTLSGEFEVGEPLGLGGSSGLADPEEAYNNRGVLGLDLSGQGAYPGDYEPNTFQEAESPVLDGTTWTNTRLIMHRRLNVGVGDEATIWLWTATGVPFYRSQGEAVTESDFLEVGGDVSGKVDGAPAVQLVFDQSSNASGQYSSWNVDDIIFKDGTLPDYGACADCGSSPSFAGLEAASDDQACAPGGVTLSWAAPVSWGTGESGSYAVYRNAVSGFTPGPGNLVASGLGGLSWTDPAAPQEVDLYYVVRAESDESCSTGPNNGGVLDGNLVERAARDTLGQPLPEFIDTVRVQGVNDAHVRLEWDPVPDVVRYRVYRAESPDMSGSFLLDETEGTVYEDVHELSTAKTYYYRVQGVNACGQE